MPKPTTLLEAITMPTGRDRGPVNRGNFASGDDRVDPDGGSRNAGIIYGASVIARGEALGHYAWIDSETLDQVEKLGNSVDGLKVRFTHPSMSGDGLGSYLGRAKNFKRDGDQVFADVHLSPTAKNTPDGDLAAYVMELADDDPEAFGMSIVFSHDFQAEEQFEIDHEEATESGGRRFVSPDPDNVENYYHVRLSALHGADFVDEPAANPSGLFHKGPTADILKQAESVAEYALGLSEEKPENTGGVSPDRLRGFLSRFLESRRLSISFQEEPEMADAKPNEETTETDPKPTEQTDAEKGSQDAGSGESAGEQDATTPADDGAEQPAAAASAGDSISREELSKYCEKFGTEKGTKYLLDGVPFEEALSKEFDALKQAKAVGGDDDRGESEPVGEYGEQGAGGSGKKAAGVSKSQAGMESVFSKSGCFAERN